MAQLIKPQQVSINTKDGELLVHITLDLNLNLGTARISKDAQDDEERPEAEKVDWPVPEFSSARVKFGKEEKA